LLVARGYGGRGRRSGGKGGGRGKVGEMTQTFYAHFNKRNLKTTMLFLSISFKNISTKYNPNNSGY
jgi:ribosomal protein L15